MSRLLLDYSLRAALAGVRRGNLGVRSASGCFYAFGDGTGPPVVARFASARVQRAVLLDPDLRLGEAYMDGTVTFERGTIADFVDLVTQEGAAWPRWSLAFSALRYCMAARQPTQSAHAGAPQCGSSLRPRRPALRIVSRQRSPIQLCLFRDAGSVTRRCPACKATAHPPRSFLVDKTYRVLDIGYGWGGLALYLGEYAGARATGITLSREQLQCARRRAAERELEKRVDFQAVDYRDVAGTFDRIVSVGMFEHVGISFYDAFFAKCAEVLADDGVMLLHSIGRSSPSSTNAWIAKYIFPGGYIPALSEVLPAIERAGLLVTDIEIQRLHYADTVKAWRDRFLAHRDEVSRLYDTRFVRMWEFYLACSETAFRHHNMMVMNIQMSKRQRAWCRLLQRLYRGAGGKPRDLRALEGRRMEPVRLAGE